MSNFSTSTQSFFERADSLIGERERLSCESKKMIRAFQSEQECLKDSTHSLIEENLRSNQHFSEVLKGASGTLHELSECMLKHEQNHFGYLQHHSEAFDRFMGELMDKECGMAVPDRVKMEVDANYANLLQQMRQRICLTKSILESLKRKAQCWKENVSRLTVSIENDIMRLNEIISAHAAAVTFSPSCKRRMMMMEENCCPTNTTQFGGCNAVVVSGRRVVQEALCEVDSLQIAFDDIHRETIDLRYHTNEFFADALLHIDTAITNRMHKCHDQREKIRTKICEISKNVGSLQTSGAELRSAIKSECVALERCECIKKRLDQALCSRVPSTNLHLTNDINYEWRTVMEQIEYHQRVLQRLTDEIEQSVAGANRMYQLICNLREREVQYAEMIRIDQFVSGLIKRGWPTF